ncbi:MAG: hypothetical protein ACRD6N_19910 [Pyrinomonadaceae bacterium]
MHFKYTRLYTDGAGESHFEDLVAELSLVDFASSAPPLYVSKSLSSKQSSFFGAPAGWISDWHPSQGRNLFVLVSGSWEIEASDGEIRIFSPNQTLLVEDTTGKGHRSKVVGDKESLAVLVQF